MSEELLSVKEVAEILRVSTQTIILWIKAGKLKAVKPGGAWRIRRSDLEELVEFTPKEGGKSDE